MSENKAVHWTIGVLTAFAAAVKAVVSLMGEIRGLLQRIRNLESTVGSLRVQNAEQEERIKHLEEQLASATSALQIATSENIRLKTEVIELKHERNKQENLAALRGELLRMHGIDPNFDHHEEIRHATIDRDSDHPDDSPGPRSGGAGNAADDAPER
jgi:septal ring factor EnvC (AmiA/AmiB activator)